MRETENMQENEPYFDDEIDLRELFNALWTAKKLIIQITAIFAIGSVLRPTKSWILFAGGNTSLSPGDTIVVLIDAGYTDNLTLWREVTQVIFNSTAGLASIVAATK